MRISAKARFEMIARCRMSIGDSARGGIALFTFLFFSGVAGAQQNPEDLLSGTSNSSMLAVDPVAIEPLKESATPVDSQPQGVHWKTLFSQSLRFTLFEHAFRYASAPWLV